MVGSVQEFSAGRTKDGKYFGHGDEKNGETGTATEVGQMLGRREVSWVGWNEESF